MKALIQQGGPRTAGLTDDDYALLAVLLCMDVSEAGLSHLADLRIAVRHARLPMEYDGLCVTHRLEFGRWLRERLVREEETA